MRESRAGVAVSDEPAGPYHFIRSARVAPGFWPENMPESQRTLATTLDDVKQNTPEWWKAVREGAYVRRDLLGGQMARDMNLFVDDDGKAYHVFASEDNSTLQIAQLTDDYLDHTGRYIRVDPAGYNEAPAILKKDGTYFMITSGTSGLDPNAARLFSAPSIWGPWEKHPNPCRGTDAEVTFHGKSKLRVKGPWKKRCIHIYGRSLETNSGVSSIGWALYLVTDSV